MKVCTLRAEGKGVIRGLKERPGFRRKAWAGRGLRIATGDSGAELLEFALVVPILLMLLLGIVWIGRAYNIYATITRAAREGARYAALPSSVSSGNTFADLPGSSCSSGTNAFINYVAPALTAGNLDPKAVLKYCQKSDWLEDTFPKQCGVSVSFSYPVELRIPFTSLDATTIDIPTQAQMRLENQPTGVTCP